MLQHFKHYPLTFVFLLLFGVLHSPDSQAADDSAVISELQAQIAALTDRLNALESRKIPVRDYEMPALSQHPTSSSSSWMDRIKLKGDFRFRQEHIDAENASNRNRQRIRARPELIATVTDTVTVGFGLATGDDDPVSSNQTLGEGSSSKGINLDLAYADWQSPIQGLSIRGGKYKNTMRRVGGNGLVWDSDLRPEGIAGVYKRGNWFGTSFALWTDESSGNDDTVVWGGQAGWRGDIRNVNLLLGSSYTQYDIRGDDVFFDGDPRGNSVAADNTYLYDYKNVELFTELRFGLAGIPTMLFVDYTQNLDADDYDKGYAVGGNLTFSDSNHPWKIGYTYQDLEADATFALFSDSDFIGGGTDGKGHIFRGNYSLTKGIALGGTLFVNERGGNVGEAEDFNRLMLDISFKY